MAGAMDDRQAGRQATATQLMQLLSFSLSSARRSLAINTTLDIRKYASMRMSAHTLSLSPSLSCKAFQQVKQQQQQKSEQESIFLHSLLFLLWLCFVAVFAR